MHPLTYMYPLSYISDQATKALKSYGLSSFQVRDILSKSLQFNDYDHLEASFNDTDCDYWVGSDLHDFGSYNMLNGFYFSEFILQEQLGLEIDKSYQLKCALDFHCFQNMVPHFGNTYFTNWNTIHEHLKQIALGKQSRIMFDYPIYHYSQMHDHEFLMKSGANYKINALWCDAISSDHRNYFLNSDNEKVYIKLIIEILTQFHELILSPALIKYLKESRKDIYKFIKDTFAHYKIYKEFGDKERFYGLLLLGDSLEKRLHSEVSTTKAFPISKVKFTPGEKVLYYMNKFGISVRELNKKADLDRKTIYNIRTDKNPPSQYSIKQLAKAFGVTPLEFYQDME